MRAAVFATSAAPNGIRVVTWPVLCRMPRYAASILRSRPFTISPGDAAALLGNRMTPEQQAWAYPQLAAESGRAAREMALGSIAVNPAGIRCPTLVLGAEHDRITPVSVERKIAARYGSEYLEAAGHAHMLMLESWRAAFLRRGPDVARVRRLRLRHPVSFRRRRRRTPLPPSRSRPAGPDEDSSRHTRERGRSRKPASPSSTLSPSPPTARRGPQAPRGSRYSSTDS